MESKTNESVFLADEEAISPIKRMRKERSNQPLMKNGI
jgi:hypothetical protein